MVITSLFYRLAVSLMLGLMIGFERGWNARNIDDGHRVAGFRTFGLIGLTGGVCAILPTDTMVAVGLVVIGCALIVFNQLEYQRDKDLGATTFMAAILTYGLGVVAVRGEPLVAAATATVAAGLLASKSPLHNWIKAVTWLELRAFLMLMAMTILVLPIMPRVAVDPWGILVPAEVWFLAVLIATLSFIGHGAVRLYGARAGGVSRGRGTARARPRRRPRRGRRPHAARRTRQPRALAGRHCTRRSRPPAARGARVA